jgi:hypothetical protein
MIGLSTRPLSAGPPAGCTADGDAEACFTPGVDPTGEAFTWNDTDQAYEDSDNNWCLFISDQGRWWDPGDGYCISYEWELDVYDADGYYVDYWLQDDYAFGITYAEWAADNYTNNTTYAPHFGGGIPEGSWQGSHVIAGGWVQGESGGTDYLYQASDTD